MELNRNKELSEFFALWKTEYEHKTSWADFISSFHDDLSFVNALNKLIDQKFNQLNLFENSYNVFLNEAKKWEKKWNDFGIKSFVIEDFHLIDSFDMIKNSLFFFYVGDLDILNKSQKEMVSVVGSRKTPKKYTNWIKDNVPKNKVVVSGLAKGADCFAHLNSIELNNKIIVIPGVDIFSYNNFDYYQKIILEYAKKNGIILTNIIPFSNYHSNFNYLKRNKWMAQISSETYAVFFTGQSGTLGQLYETAKLQKSIYMPKDVYEINKHFLENHKYFNILMNKIKTLG